MMGKHTGRGSEYTMRVSYKSKGFIVEFMFSINQKSKFQVLSTNYNINFTVYTIILNQYETRPKNTPEALIKELCFKLA